MAAGCGAAVRPLVAALALLPLAAAVNNWIPGLTGRRGGAGGLPHHLLSPSMNYGGIFGKRQLTPKRKTGGDADAAAAEDEVPARHRLVVCNAYRGTADLAAIHKRAGDSREKSLLSGVPFKKCDVSHMEFKEGDSIVFKMGGVDVGSFDSHGALGLSHGQEVSLVMVPYQTPGHGAAATAQVFAHVFRTPKEVGSQVILADTLKEGGESVLQMSDRQGRLHHVHHDQELTLQPGRFQFTAQRVHDSANISSTHLQVATGNKDALPKYLVVRLEADPLGGAAASQEIITFSLPVPASKHSAPGKPL
mmetsp:Transcript_27528/g.72081  ORF Transcript_27528/g.72081 Transcript_27528/m.72081 type:complete len:306 (-) Transcript_27528:103-1020(-)